MGSKVGSPTTQGGGARRNENINPLIQERIRLAARFPAQIVDRVFGVEAGQLLFVSGALIGFRLIRTMVSTPVPRAHLVAAYSIGTISMLWLFARVASFTV